MRASGRNLIGLLRAFRVTLVVFVAVVAVAYVQRGAVASLLARMDAHPYLSDTTGLPERFWLVLALRLGVFVAAVPLAVESWILLCRRRSPARARLWPLFGLATTLALAGALALTWHFAGALRSSIIYVLDAPAPSAPVNHRNASGGLVRPPQSPS